MSVSVCLCLSLSAFSSFKHVHLERSDPSAQATLAAAPGAIRLWFSAPVQVGITTIHLTSAAGQAIETARPHQGEGADAPVIAEVRGALPAGAFQVSWRTMSRDGHVVSGAFAFSVAAPPARGR